MKISIAMATYNGSKYLQEQLESFANQTRYPDELVITDDCSSDNTLQIIELFNKKSPFEIRCYKNDKNLGYIKSFNKALSLCKGDLVFLSDQDDVWFSNKIKRMEEVALNSNAMAWMNDAILTDSKLTNMKFTKIGQTRSLGLSDSAFVIGCCAAFRKKFLDLALPIPKDYQGHDNWLLEIAAGIGRKQIVKEALQYHRLHDSNQSQTITNIARKVTKFDLYTNAIRKFWQSFGKNISDIGHNELIQAQLLFEGVKRGENLCDDEYRDAFGRYAKDIKRRISILKNRNEIIKKNRLSRIYGVIKLWARGDYKYLGDLNIIARDMFY